ERVQEICAMMPAATDADWAAVARRMSRVPAALAGFRESLDQASRCGSFTAAPRQVRLLAGQLDDWLADAAGRGWYAGFAAPAQGPPAPRAELDGAAAPAPGGNARLAGRPRAEDAPRATGPPG